jgi:hypothetical protein
VENSWLNCQQKKKNPIRGIQGLGGKVVGVAPRNIEDHRKKGKISSS